MFHYFKKMQTVKAAAFFFLVFFTEKNVWLCAKNPSMTNLNKAFFFLFFWIQFNTNKKNYLPQTQMYYI